MKKLLALALAGLALAGAACGGDDDGDDSYSAAVRDVSTKLDAGSLDVRNVKTPEELAAVLREAAGLLDDAAGELEGIEPPDEVAGAHQNLIEGSRGSAEVLREVADRAKAGKGVDAAQSLNELFRSGAAKKLTDGVNELEEKGYDVSPQGNAN